jgi:hypothetical protein
LTQSFFPVLTMITTIHVWSSRLLNFSYYITCSKNNINDYLITLCYLKVTKADLCPCIIISKHHIATVPILDSKLIWYINIYTSNTDEISTNTSVITKPDWQTKAPWKITILHIVEHTIK